MAAPNPALHKARVLMHIGEQDNTSGPVAPNIDVLWDLHEEEAAGNIKMQFLLTKKEAIEITIGAIWRGEYQKIGGIQKDALDDKATFLKSLLKEVDTEISNMCGSFRINLDYIEPDPTC